jgi:hypothetical protein
MRVSFCVGVVLLLLAALTVGGCGSGEADSPSELLVGTWVTDLWGAIEVFNEDGTYGVGHTVDLASGDDVSQAELGFGTWSIDGSILTRSSDPESPYCGGMEGTYEIEFLDDGDRVAVTVVSDDCPTQRKDFGSGLSRYMDS